MTKNLKKRKKNSSAKKIITFFKTNIIPLNQKKSPLCNLYYIKNRIKFSVSIVRAK